MSKDEEEPKSIPAAPIAFSKGKGKRSKAQEISSDEGGIVSID